VKKLLGSLTDMEAARSELEHYLEIAKERADNDLKGLRGNAEKRIRETDKRLAIISENGILFQEAIDDNSSAMDKYSQKIFEVIEQTISEIAKPEKLNLRTIQQYSDTTRSALLTQDEILIKYVKLLKGTKYKKRVKLLSKALQKLNNDLSKLERFIIEDYTPNADLENIFTDIEDTIDLINRYEDIWETLLGKQDQVVTKDEEIAELKSQLEELIDHPVKRAYQESVDKYTETQKQIDSHFSNIRKALRKYENIVAKSREKTDTTLVKELIKDAANCLAAQSSMGSVENLLRIILDKLENAALQLKKDKRETTKIDIQNLLDGDLAKYWQDSKDAVKSKEDQQMKLRELDLESKIQKLRTSVDGASRDRNRIIEREIRDLLKMEEDIEKSVTEISTRLTNALGEQIQLEVNIIKIPGWAEAI
jgi:uncharacterized protein YukE